MLRSQGLLEAAAWGQRGALRCVVKGAPTAGRKLADGSDVGRREAEEGRQTPSSWSGARAFTRWGNWMERRGGEEVWSPHRRTLRVLLRGPPPASMEATAPGGEKRESQPAAEPKEGWTRALRMVTTVLASPTRAIPALPLPPISSRLSDVSQQGETAERGGSK